MNIEFRRFRPEDQPAVRELSEIALKDTGALHANPKWYEDLYKIDFSGEGFIDNCDL